MKIQGVQWVMLPGSVLQEAGQRGKKSATTDFKLGHKNTIIIIKTGYINNGILF